MRAAGILLVAGLVACAREIRDEGSLETSSAGPAQGGGSTEAGAGGGDEDGDDHGAGGAGGGGPARLGLVIASNYVDVSVPGEKGGALALFEEVVEDLPLDRHHADVGARGWG